MNSQKPLTAKELLPKDYLNARRNRNGYLPDQDIREFIHYGMIHSAVSILPSQIQPASLDLRLGDKAYRIQSSFLPEGDRVEDRLKELTLYEVDLRDKAILEKHAIYLIPLQEELELPDFVQGRTNPKSSTGRLDMFCRVIIDRGNRFDEVPAGYRGKMYLEIISRSFTVNVKTGLSLNQLRLFQGQPQFTEDALGAEYRNNAILYSREGGAVPCERVKVEGGLFIGVDLKGREPDAPIAYKSRANSSVIDLTRTRHYDPREFWEPIFPNPKNRLIISPDEFYIMMSREKICIRPHLLAEMIAWEPNSGELRTHYAGFFDPGFGYFGEKETRQGTRAVMEVRPHDVPFMVEDGQTFCRLKFEKVTGTPGQLYGEELNSHYHSQELSLSKYFKPYNDR